MNTVIIYHDIDTPDAWLWIRLVQQGEEVPKEGIGFTGAKAMEQLARGKVESASQIALGILAWRHDFLLLAFRHPGRPDFGEELDIKLIGKDHDLMRL
jgi:hypothetical protein